MIAMATALPGLSPSALAQRPGPELFAKEPQTPIELWEAADYLIRTGQADEGGAVSRQVPEEPARRRDPGRDPGPVRGRARSCGWTTTRRPGRSPGRWPTPWRRPRGGTPRGPTGSRGSSPTLTQTPEEQDYAVRRLREAGPYAVPSLIEALRQPGLSPQDHDLLVRNMGRLEPSAVPPLAAALESPEPAVASADAATALGAIGDAKAVPFLTFRPRPRPARHPTVRAAAQAAIARLTGRPFAAQPRTPVQVLTDAAWAVHRQRSELPDEPVIDLGLGRRAVKVPVAARGDARGGQDDPRPAGSRGRPCGSTRTTARPRSPSSAWPWRRPSSAPVPTRFRPQDPATLRRGDRRRARRSWAEVLETAIADGKPDLAAAAVLALAKVTDRAALAGRRAASSAGQALTAPGRRAQFAAARALVDLAPDRPFPGSSLVAPDARPVRHQPAPAPRRGHRRQPQPGRPVVAGSSWTSGYRPRSRSRPATTASSPPPSRPTSS